MDKSLIRTIHDGLLIGMSNDLIKESIKKKVFSRDVIKNNKTEIVAFKDDPLLKCRLITYPELYNNCRENRVFLDKYHLNIPFVRLFSKCVECTHNINTHCEILRGKLLDENDRVPFDVIKFKIEELMQKSPGLSKKYTDIENYEYLSGLKAAIFASKNKSSVEDSYKKTSSDPSNSLSISSCQCNDEGDARVWAMVNLERGNKIDDVYDILSKKYGDDARLILNSAIMSMVSVSPDIFADCKNQSFKFSSSAKLDKSKKCIKCDASNQIWCLKLKLPFAITNAKEEIFEESPEAKEIKSYFTDYKNDIIIESAPVRKNIEILFDNPGQHMPVDIGQDQVKIDIDLQDMMLNTGLGDIELNPPLKIEPPLNIKGIGGSVGFDLSKII